MNRFFVPLLTVLLAALIYAGSVAYDNLVTARIQQKQMAAPSKSITGEKFDKKTVQIVPDFAFTTLNGKKFNIADLRGSVVIINFWATWCAPCLAEFPDLLDIIDQQNGKVILVALSSDQTKEPVQKFIADQAHKHAHPLDPKLILIGMDPGRHITRDLFNVTTYPESFVVGQDGRVMKHIIGIDDWSKAETQNLIKNMVHNTKSP